MNRQEGSPGRGIATLFRRSRVHLDRVFEPLGLGKGLYLYLALLSRDEGLTQHQVALELALDEGTVARAVQKLMDSGWLRREKDGRDGRAYRVFLAPRAVEAMPNILKELEAWDRLITKGFTDKEAELALNFLKKSAANADSIGR